jgi:hypothetical protein
MPAPFHTYRWCLCMRMMMVVVVYVVINRGSYVLSHSTWHVFCRVLHAALHAVLRLHFVPLHTGTQICFCRIHVSPQRWRKQGVVCRDSSVYSCWGSQTYQMCAVMLICQLWAVRCLLASLHTLRSCPLIVQARPPCGQACSLLLWSFVYGHPVSIWLPHCNRGMKDLVCCLLVAGC